MQIPVVPSIVPSSQSSDLLASNTSAVSSESSSGRQPPHTAYILQPPSNSSNNASRNRMRDRKHQSSLRHGQKSTSTSNTMLDDQPPPPPPLQPSSSTNMRSLDRRHVRAVPQNASSNSNMSKTPTKSSHTDIYGSLERNKHSKVSQPTLHGTILNGDNERMTKPDHQAHDFYHLTSPLPMQSNTTSTIVNVGTALQQQTLFDQIDSVPPPLPPPTHRSRRPPPSVFQPHFDSSTSTTPKDNYYTISGAKDVSTHSHTQHIRGLVADNFYNGPYASKPPATASASSAAPNQTQGMQRYDTSPLLARRLDQMYPSHAQQHQSQPNTPRYHPQTYNRTQSSSMMATSQAPMPVGRSTHSTTNIEPSALLFRPHSSQSSSSQSSG